MKTIFHFLEGLSVSSRDLRNIGLENNDQRVIVNFKSEKFIDIVSIKRRQFNTLNFEQHIDKIELC